MPGNCWKIEYWIEAFLTAKNPMKEYECLQSKFTEPFDVSWNNFMPTSHFPFYACFWILIATTGTFQLICIMNSVIIQRPLLRNKHVICPQNEFYHLLCNCTPLVSSESGCQTSYCLLFQDVRGEICVFCFISKVVGVFNYTTEIKSLVCWSFFQCSCLFLYVHSRFSSHGMACVCVHVKCVCVYIYGCTIACLNLTFGGWFLRGMAKLERPPKILCSNWNCFIFSFIN